MRWFRDQFIWAFALSLALPNGKAKQNTIDSPLLLCDRAVATKYPYRIDISAWTFTGGGINGGGNCAANGEFSKCISRPNESGEKLAFRVIWVVCPFIV